MVVNAGVVLVMSMSLGFLICCSLSIWKDFSLSVCVAAVRGSIFICVWAVGIGVCCLCFIHLVCLVFYEECSLVCLVFYEGGSLVCLVFYEECSLACLVFY